MILIVSGTEDVHATTVESMLHRRGRSTCLFDPGEFPQRCELTVRGGNSGLSSALIAGDTRVQLSEVTSVWYRRPQRFNLPDSLLPEERAWTRLECVRTFDALWQNTEAFWVSPPEAIRAAGLKLVQLRLAASLGLRIPRFLVTNSPQDALELFAVGIDTRGFDEALTDFRRADVYDLPHKVLTLPRSVHAACLALVRELGLRFGAIDLLLTPDGEYVFLEINPNGQWIWLEWVTGLPLADTMCDLLCGVQPNG